ncbi:hypothetical protein P153DRAFT_17255 [Dothidotthia symphoricarpi CBS 119687]|uniref:Uncharacterized protein n=1 Tax=Dothidotthia symphoricarpi CBS 119687 TaxID=1392245 RepID=A0A6A6ABI8_9PLEO|nr:uncharacterized protein P153DRAFT_17255 [Dothidotthia symphoricarpi CBS 119687]KAF2129312.1 hypothetical protein P153DRAFT_17255 [Dothidotthia symphoricarpi CBS 119687]
MRPHIEQRNCVYSQCLVFARLSCPALSVFEFTASLHRLLQSLLMATNTKQPVREAQPTAQPTSQPRSILNVSPNCPQTIKQASHSSLILETRSQTSTLQS